jgi:hypothetical protein
VVRKLENSHILRTQNFHRPNYGKKSEQITRLNTVNAKENKMFIKSLFQCSGINNMPQHSPFPHSPL